MSFGDWSRRRFVGGFIDDISEVERQVRGLRRSGVLSFDAAQVEGDLIGNRIIAPSDASNTEPTDAGFSGWFLSAAVQALADGNFGLANVLLGAVQYGIGESGEFIRGVSFLSNHLATVGAYDRRARRGFQEVDSKPAYLVEFIDDAVGTNLITVNPGFETGSLATGYSAHTNWAIYSTAPITGSYSAQGGASLDPITTNKYASTALSAYRFSLKSKALATYFWIEIKINWYDATPTLILTDYLASSEYVDTTGREFVGTFFAPTGSTQFEISAKVKVGVSAAIIVDDFSATLVGEYAAIRLDDNGVYAVDEIGEVNVLGFPQSDLQFASQMITSVTVADTVDSNYKWGFYRGPAYPDSADGDEYLFQFTLAAGTYTLYAYGRADATSGKVDYYLNDETTPFATGQDWYASPAAPTQKTITGVVIEVGGRQTIKVKVNGRTATYYRWLPTALWFVPATYTPKAGAPEPVPTVDYYRLLESGDDRLMEDGVSKRILG